MRGIDAAFVCLVSLHCLSVVDAHAARFTSENGMPGREHEDKHPRRTAKRSLPRAVQNYVYDYYNGEDYSGMSFVPLRDVNVDMSLDTYYDYKGDQNTLDRLLNPEEQRRSAGAKKSSSASPGETERQYYYYDNWENYGGIPNIPPFTYRDADADEDTRADADKTGFTKTLRQLLSPVVESVVQLWGKLTGKPLRSVGGGDTKREDAGYDPLKKRATENRNDDDGGAADPRKPILSNPFNYLTEMAKKALDFAYKVIDKIDVSKLTDETKKLKEAILDILKKARDAVEELLDKVARGEESSSRRARSVGKRTNARDALESYLTSLKSLKRSKTRNSLRRSMNAPAGQTDMTALMDLMAEMEDCINKIPATNTSRLGVSCIVLPLIKALASPKLGGASDLTADGGSNASSDTIDPPDNLRRLNFPWGSIFLIPIYNGPATPPDFPDDGCENVTTTTTSSTTEAAATDTLPTPVFDEPDEAVRSNSKYRSKYDNF